MLLSPPALDVRLPTALQVLQVPSQRALKNPNTSGVQTVNVHFIARDAAQTGHKRKATNTGRHVVTQGSLGDGGASSAAASFTSLLAGKWYVIGKKERGGLNKLLL